MAGPSSTMSQESAKNAKRSWSVQGSKFFEHMDDEVPGYGESAEIMYSLHHQKNFVQTGSDRKIQNCAHLFQHATAVERSSATPSKAAEVPARRLDLLASPKRGSSAKKTESPMRRAMSKFKNKLKVESPRRQPYAESILESVRSGKGDLTQQMAEQHMHAQGLRARKWSFSSAASEKQFKTNSGTK